ncbi:MAG: arsenite efflux transporter metallochaperone ArsD [Actinomycetes bacterium]
MTTIRVYEPALCCNTGVCGPELDQSLVTFTADLNHLKSLGADIERHNLANDPSAFADNPTARDFLRVAGSDGLPLTVVDGVTVMTGGYPSRGQLVGYASSADLTAAEQVVPVGASQLGMADSSGCCGSSGCC